MPSFPSYDSTVLSYRVVGSGPVLVCLPGGPARDSVYLGDLGGLAAHRTLVLLDNRGSGQSADASDVDSYRVDRLALDVEALRQHLGLEQMNLLGHSGGAQIAVLYAATHPQRLSSLVLLNGGQRVMGCVIDSLMGEAIKLRSDEPWFEDALAAINERIAGQGSASPEVMRRQDMFFYGRPWTPEKAAHAAADETEKRTPEAIKNFAFEPDLDAVYAGLAQVTAPVLIYTGEVDPAPRPAEAALMAKRFPNATVVTQPDAGHMPWLDDPAWFVSTVTAHPAP